MNTKLDVLPQNEQAGISFISTYPISIPSFVKLLEIVFLVISFVLSNLFKDGSKNIIQIKWNIQQFHLLISVLSVVGCIFIYAAYCFNIIRLLQRRFQTIYLFLTLLHVTGVIFLLISTSMIIQSCVDIRNFKVLNFDTCREIKKLTSTSCSVCEGSAAAGFLALIVLVFDTYLHCLKYLDIKRRLAIAKEEEEKSKEKLPSP
ncbi:uncharacterized protein LOC136091411 [Hydra vulgaris]|uniref:Uncharacterized protein LOC136091411 n=1 Tax=Hydra vulgaris TaxID=6087 RepID=A0ABM4DKH2_HYDVU